jgi:O-acetyl-ADP-ribose deacetylase
VWQGGNAGEAELLASAYRTSLELAARHGLRTIAFPAISCGVYGYPLDQAAGIALTTVRAFLERAPAIEQVRHVCFGPAVLAAYRDAFERLG